MGIVAVCMMIAAAWEGQAAAEKLRLMPVFGCID
jgi:tellurite resistance protein